MINLKKLEYETEKYLIISVTHSQLPLTVMVYLESMYAIDLVMKRRHFSYQSL